MANHQYPVIPDEASWLRESAIHSSSSSSRSGGYQNISNTSTSRPRPPSRQTTDHSPPKKPSKRITPTENAKVQAKPLPDGCVDLFVAESESSDDSEDASSGKNVWRKMKGRLKSDINDFTTSGAHLQ